MKENGKNYILHKITPSLPSNKQKNNILNNLLRIGIAAVPLLGFGVGAYLALQEIDIRTPLQRAYMLNQEFYGTPDGLDRKLGANVDIVKLPENAFLEISVKRGDIIR